MNFIRLFDSLNLTILAIVIGTTAQAQVFPDAASLSTGQGNIGELDTVWSASRWFDSPPSSPLGLLYTPALINNSCAPGAWVDPTQLPPPVNNANWITGSEGSCDNNPISGFRFFRLTLELPEDCAGQSILTPGTYVLYLSGYADNTITDVFVNGTSTGISGGDFTPFGFLAMELTGPWVMGTNYVDVLIENFPGGENNPYGLLLVADSNAGSNSDLDNDGFADFVDECPCEPGVENGCDPQAMVYTICSGETITLSAPIAGVYFWSTLETDSSIIVAPLSDAAYTLTIDDAAGLSWDYIYEVVVFPSFESAESILLCGGSSTIFQGETITEPGIYSASLSTIQGCDSLVQLTVEFLPVQASFDERLLCSGDTLWIEGQSITNNGSFEVVLMDNAGCDSIVTLVVTLIDCKEEPCLLSFPNIFTPNGDGLNDRFDLTPTNCSPEGFSLTVFSRWGSAVFTSDNATREWRGDCGGSDCPTGVYYYVAIFEDEHGNPERKAGYVHLSR